MLVLYGQSSGPVPPFELRKLNDLGSLFITRPSLAHYTQDRAELELRAGEVLGAIAAGRLAVRIGARFPLADAAAAHRALEGRATTGKVLLTHRSPPMTRLALALALAGALGSASSRRSRTPSPTPRTACCRRSSSPTSTARPARSTSRCASSSSRRDMTAGDMVKDAVEKAGPGPLRPNGAVYVVDLVGHAEHDPQPVRDAGDAPPAVRLLVDAEGAKTADFPSAEGRPTVLVLDKLKVVSASNPKSVDELLAAIAPPAPASP